MIESVKPITDHLLMYIKSRQKNLNMNRIQINTNEKLIKNSI